MVKTQRFIAAKTETPSLEEIMSHLNPVYIHTSHLRKSLISSSSFPKHFPAKKLCMEVLFLLEKYMLFPRSDCCIRHETHQQCHLIDERRLVSSVLHPNRLAKTFVQCCNVVHYD